MNLMELYSPTPTGYYSEKDDNTAIKSTDTRKLEHEQKLEKVSMQYKPPVAAETGLGL